MVTAVRPGEVRPTPPCVKGLAPSPPAGSPTAALDAVRRVGGSAKRVLAAGLRRFDRSPVQVEAAMEREAQGELRRLQRGLGVLASTSVTAPLLGFLGTAARRGTNQPTVASPSASMSRTYSAQKVLL